LSKEVIIVAGGNGVGKTTFALEFLLENPGYEFLNADEIAKELSPENPQDSKISAGKTFFKKLDEYVRDGKSFLIESTLSGRYLFKLIPSLKEKGYQIRIMFIFVDSPDILIERIAERVKKGGHFVPDADVRRRFERGKHNFFDLYENVADKWFLFYNTGNDFQLTAIGESYKMVLVNEDLFNKF